MLIKKYISFFSFCVGILLIGIILSVSTETEMYSVALFFSFFLLVAAIGAVYLSYLYWFQGTKARKNLTTSIEQLANRNFIFRYPKYDPAFMFWFIRLTIPLVAIFVSGLFLLIVVSAFL